MIACFVKAAAICIKHLQRIKSLPQAQNLHIRPKRMQKLHLISGGVFLRLLQLGFQDFLIESKADPFPA
jgi:hypothetical protein